MPNSICGWLPILFCDLHTYIHTSTCLQASLSGFFLLLSAINICLLSAVCCLLFAACKSSCLRLFPTWLFIFCFIRVKSDWFEIKLDSFFKNKQNCWLYMFKVMKYSLSFFWKRRFLYFILYICSKMFLDWILNLGYLTQEKGLKNWFEQIFIFRLQWYFF